MTIKELEKQRREYVKLNHPYQLIEWSEFNYYILRNIIYRGSTGRGQGTYNDAIIMADTETSKKATNDHNHIVAWTISIRAFNMNLVTLYGHKPSEFINALNKILDVLKGDNTYIYFHNLAYDWFFLRKFLIREYGEPISQLNTKPHYPIVIKFDNGLIIKDSLILSQRGIAKWAKDMKVEHQKAVGKWDYNKVRSQAEKFTADELEYIEHDTLAGVECIQATMNVLHKTIFSLPYTATGIPREDVRKIGKENFAREEYLKCCPDYETQVILEKVYHGGYTHGNRHYVDYTFNEDVLCKDFASSYPYSLLAYKYPRGSFGPLGENKPMSWILEQADDYAFIFKLIMIKPRLKNDDFAMPVLQLSKCEYIVNPVIDNGRVLCAEYVEIYTNEIDLSIIAEQYADDGHSCVDIRFSHKDFLPRWFTDYIYSLFRDKTLLKSGDPVLYNIAKAKLNSVYGMCVQHPVKETIIEDYNSADCYIKEDEKAEDIYNEFTGKYTSILPYQWGVWCTSYAMRNVHMLGSCCREWLYTDTDSVFGIDWNEEFLNNYNDNVKSLLKKRGYPAINFNGREYWLGVAEQDKHYTQFRYLGAKRYCGYDPNDDRLHITVAGVPKNGFTELNNDIENFTAGLIFRGSVTGKLTHTYIPVDEIYVDSEGNETGDSINLTQCDYLLDSVIVEDWEEIYRNEISIQVYDDVLLTSRENI